MTVSVAVSCELVDKWCTHIAVGFGNVYKVVHLEITGCEDADGEALEGLGRAVKLTAKARRQAR